MILHMRHIRAAGLCASGARAWCTRHRVDLRRLVREGLPIEELERWREDPFVQRAIAQAQLEVQADAQ